jgi:hypothetical protein
VCASWAFLSFQKGLITQRLWFKSSPRNRNYTAPLAVFTVLRGSAEIEFGVHKDLPWVSNPATK